MAWQANALISVLLIAVAAHATPVQSETEDQEIAQSDLHDIMSNRITDAVTRMELLLHDHSRSEDEVEKERSRVAAVIGDSAAELQHSVDFVLALEPRLAIPPEQVPQFTGFAKTLKVQALELETLARQHRYEMLKPAHERMKATCTSCHQQFRGY